MFFNYIPYDIKLLKLTLSYAVKYCALHSKILLYLKTELIFFVTRIIIL